MLRLRVRFVEVQKYSRVWSSIRRSPKAPAIAVRLRCEPCNATNGKVKPFNGRISCQISRLASTISSGVSPIDHRPPINAPMLLPPTRSISMPASDQGAEHPDVREPAGSSPAEHQPDRLVR